MPAFQSQSTARRGSSVDVRRENYRPDAKAPSAILLRVGFRARRSCVALSDSAYPDESEVVYCCASPRCNRRRNPVVLEAQRRVITRGSKESEYEKRKANPESCVRPERSGPVNTTHVEQAREERRRSLSVRRTEGRARR